MTGSSPRNHVSGPGHYGRTLDMLLLQYLSLLSSDTSVDETRVAALPLVVSLPGHLLTSIVVELYNLDVTSFILSCTERIHVRKTNHVSNNTINTSQAYIRRLLVRI
jgi:hypothetical protein